MYTPLQLYNDSKWVRLTREIGYPVQRQSLRHVSIENRGLYETTTVLLFNNKINYFLKKTCRVYEMYSSSRV